MQQRLSDHFKLQDYNTRLSSACCHDCLFRLPCPPALQYGPNGQTTEITGFGSSSAVKAQNRSRSTLPLLVCFFYFAPSFCKFHSILYFTLFTYLFICCVKIYDFPLFFNSRLKKHVIVENRSTVEMLGDSLYCWNKW